MKIDTIHIYRIKEQTKENEYVSLGENKVPKYFNAVRWEETNKKDREFVFIKHPDKEEYKILSLREDAGSNVWLTVASDENIIGSSFLQFNEPSQLFSLVNFGDFVAFKQGAKNKYMDVNKSTGNIAMWEGDSNGNPKDNQLFKLKKLR